MFSSPLKDISNVVLGYSSIYVMTSATNIENTAHLYSSSNYIGGITGANFSLSKSFSPIYEKDPTESNPVLYLKENKLVSVEAAITGTIVELSKANMSLVFGNGGTDILDFSSIPFVRVEMRFMYPNKINGIHIIFPKCQIITESPTLEFFKDDDPISLEVTMRACVVGHTLWQEKYGSFDFI